MNKKIVAIIQARMGSSRLPGKVLMPIMNKPVLWHIHHRLSCVEKIDGVHVATSYLKRDDVIADFCKENDIKCFRGNEADVLDRFYKAATEAEADYLIRVTGDCPLVDPALIGQLIDYFFEKKLHYCGVATGAGVATEDFYGRFPDGLDAEIFRFSALEKAWKEADGLLYREHVTPYIWKHPKKFKNGVLRSNGKDYSELRWTMDNHEDYEVIQSVYENLYPGKPGFDMNDVLDLMAQQPQIFSKNKQFVGREGYDEFWN